MSAALEALRIPSPPPTSCRPALNAAQAEGVDRAPHAVLASAGPLTVSVAATAREIEQALRLRHRVFAGELGARVDGPEGLDRDIFDPYCRHLVVRDTSTDRVVGTYRVLMPEQARLLGCLYAEGEFWLTRLNPLRDSIVELGRSCVDPEYRSGAAIMLLWSGLGALLSGTGHRYLIGCVSVPLADGGALAAGLYRKLSREHLAEDWLRVWPRERLPLERFGNAAEPAVPALMKGYLRAGAKLLGEPHVDAAFGCADFPMMLGLDALGARHRRRFLQ
ncbi:MAG: hypothetical protein RIS35_2354 [Pseudomonadota bacterium]